MLFRSVDLRSGVDSWVESILHCQVGVDRLAVHEQVQKSGFAVADVADRIEKVYLGLRN